MTASGRYASPDSSFGRSTSNAAARGGALIAVAVVIGFLLLWQGGVGGSGTAAEVDGATDEDISGADTDDGSTDEDDVAAPDDSTDSDDTADPGTGEDGDAGDTTTTTTTTVAALRLPGEVRAAVANGTETGGLAGSRSGELATAGYVTAAVNAANNTAVSNVYYVDDYGNEAEQVAILLGGDASVLRPATAEDLLSLVREDNQAEIDGFHILVVLGSDQVLG